MAVAGIGRAVNMYHIKVRPLHLPAPAALMPVTIQWMS
jgi:hypothetical protein